MNLNPLSDPNRSVLLSPPEYDVTSRDGAVVEYEWNLTDRLIRKILADIPILWFEIETLQSSLQTIRELTEVRK